jgi:ribosomal protein L15
MVKQRATPSNRAAMAIHNPTRMNQRMLATVAGGPASGRGGRGGAGEAGRGGAANFGAATT